MTTYDKEAIYDAEIAPLMTKIIAICREHDIPMAATFQYARKEEDDPAFCTTTLPRGDRCSPRLNRIIHLMQPEPAVSFAEMTVTNPDGSKVISIRRVT